MAKFNINIPQNTPDNIKKEGERNFDGPYVEDPKKTYDQEGEAAEWARNTQRLDTHPGIEKEGYLDVSDLDRLRRRKLYRTV